ncbi:MAG TPA: 3-isopropylmalate dehydrogenase [Candidatus Methylomirabilis sp.]|jgi:3-isopropylmalate dehydrogenase|nr:3-isopropylmalate dehydrogenase [Candidatus Methylomirabilis sp.]
MATQIAVLKGDGIGPEVVDQALLVLQAAATRFGLALTFREALLGGAAVDATGDPLPEETLARCRESRAILLGAVGGPKWDRLPTEQRPERGILRLRAALGLYANLRPARLSPALVEASSLKREVVEGTDLLVVRELTGGLYFGTPRGIERVPDGERAVDTLAYTTAEITRIARVAFEAAAGRRKKVTSVDKANVLASSELWRQVVEAVHRDFPGVTLEHMYVDSCAMQLIRSPRAFDVILTENMFGDILSDEAAMLTGSIGMLPSASLGAEIGLYEPIHGTAPDLVGKDVANPIAAVLSGALLCRYSLRREDVAAAIERAVEAILAAGWRTADLARPGEATIGTTEMGRRLAEAVARP